MAQVRVFINSVIYMTLMTLEFISATTLNGYILKVSTGNLKSKLSPTELIYFFMGFVNIFLQAMVTVQTLLFNYFSRLYFLRDVYFTLYIAVFASMFYSLWLTAWLCFHFCISIANFNHQVFVWLRRVFSSYLEHIVITSTVGPMVLTFLSIWCLQFGVQGQRSLNYSSKPIFMSILHFQSPAYRMTNVLLGGGPPFIKAFISTGTTAVSLLRHIHHFKNNLPGISGSHLQALTNATLTMISFLTLSLTLYISQLYLFTVTGHGERTAYIFWLIIMSYPSAEALIIILASPKMKKGIFGRVCIGI